MIFFKKKLSAYSHVAHFSTDKAYLILYCSFQFETEIEGSKLRRDVLASGSISTGPTLSGIASLLSGQEELFAFRRAVSTNIKKKRKRKIVS